MSTDSIGSSGAVPAEEASNVNNSGSGSGSPSGEINGATLIPTMEALRKASPEVYNQMLIGIGTTACKRMQRSQDRIKQIMRKDQAHQA